MEGAVSDHPRGRAGGGCVRLRSSCTRPPLPGSRLKLGTAGEDSASSSSGQFPQLTPQPGPDPERGTQGRENQQAEQTRRFPSGKQVGVWLLWPEPSLPCALHHLQSPARDCRLPGAPLAKALGPTSCSVTSAPQFAVRKRKSICHSALAFFLVGNGQAAYTLTSLTKTFFFFLQ